MANAIKDWLLIRGSGIEKAISTKYVLFMRFIGIVVLVK